MSSYAPVWVKEDTGRFPRVVENGSPVEVLSPQGTATEEADARAFAALMRHIVDVDGRDHTVLMMQVENEVGVRGDTRDHSAASNRAFLSPVPAELMRYLQAHRDCLYSGCGCSRMPTVTRPPVPGGGVWGHGTCGRDFHGLALRPLYSGRGSRRQGGLQHSDVREHMAGRGRCHARQLPQRWPGAVGRRYMKGAGSAIDFYSPDLYDPNFALWWQRYHRGGNPLFMPQTRGGAAGAANVFHAVGEQAGFGFSPFGIDSEMETKGDLAESYGLLAQLSAMITQHQARARFTALSSTARIPPCTSRWAATPCTFPSMRSSAATPKPALDWSWPRPRTNSSGGEGLSRAIYSALRAAGRHCIGRRRSLRRSGKMGSGPAAQRG
jgi:hypothetical protein